MNTTRPLRIGALLAALGIVAGVSNFRSADLTADRNDAALPSGVTPVVHRTAPEEDVTSASAAVTTEPASALLTGERDATGAADDAPALDPWTAPAVAAAVITPLQVTSTAVASVRA